MDLVRSCYTGLMRLDPNSEVLTPVRWYFTFSNAVKYGPTRLCSGNWDPTNEPRPEWTGEGEVPGAERDWCNGVNPTVGTPGCPRGWQGDARGGEGQGGSADRAPGPDAVARGGTGEGGTSKSTATIGTSAGVVPRSLFVSGGPAVLCPTSWGPEEVFDFDQAGPDGPGWYGFVQNNGVEKDAEMLDNGDGRFVVKLFCTGFPAQPSVTKNPQTVNPFFWQDATFASSGCCGAGAGRKFRMTVRGNGL